MSLWRKGLSNTKICGKSIPGRKMSICQGPVVGSESMDRQCRSMNKDSGKKIPTSRTM